MELTILMPCLNEEKTIGICVNKAISFLKKNNIEGEVLVIDNGSTDKSAHIAAYNGARVCFAKRKGYGAALQEGNKQAYGKYIIMGDCDDSYNFNDILPFLESLKDGNEFVIGNRFIGKIEKGAMSFLHKYIGNPLLSFIGRKIYKCNIGDFHCGLRGYLKESIEKLNLNCDGMEYASEMVIRATQHNLKTAEIPITLYKDGRSGRSHLRTFQDGFRHLHILIKYRKGE